MRTLSSNAQNYTWNHHTHAEETNQITPKKKRDIYQALTEPKEVNFNYTI